MPGSLEPGIGTKAIAWPARDAIWSGLSCPSSSASPFLTMDELASHLRIGGGRGDRNRQLAVVGSSGNLLGSGLGSVIDEAVVIRVNDAPTAQHERDVGSQTSLRYGTLEGLTNALSDARRFATSSAREVLALQPGAAMWANQSAPAIRRLWAQRQLHGSLWRKWAQRQLNDSCRIAQAAGENHPVALINTTWLMDTTSPWVNGTHMASTGFGALAFAITLAVRAAKSNSWRSQM